MKTLNIIACLLFFSCQRQGQYLERIYDGYHAETRWTYEFKKDGHFIFSSKGHFGNSITVGEYLIGDSMIFLNPETDWSSVNGLLKTKLKLMSGNCLKDLESNYYCSRGDSVDLYNELEMNFQEKVQNILYGLPIVKETIDARYSKGVELNTEITITYGGIVNIKRIEHHLFYLQLVGLKDSVTLLTFVVNKAPLEIYQHFTKMDSLNLLYKE